MTNYVRQTWHDNDVSTPISAARLSHLEDGINAHTHDMADLASGIIAIARLATGVADNTTYLRGDGTWGVPPGSAGTDATTVTKGIIRLGGDIGGTALNPTVPGLAGKAAVSHAHTDLQAQIDTISGQVAVSGINTQVNTPSGIMSLQAAIDDIYTRLASVGSSSTSGAPIVLRPEEVV